MKLCVVGGGIAGMAAVHRALEAGHECEWVLGAPGASAAWSGALDWDAWSWSSPVNALAPELVHFGKGRLGWSLPAEGALVIGADGALRPARGTDGALLDVRVFAGRSIAVVCLERPGCSGAWIARGLNESPWAQRTQTRFEPLALGALELGVPLGVADVDFALACELRREVLVSELRSAIARLGTRPAALLFGPWLAANVGTVAELSEALALPVGETLSPPHGLAGARFEQRRDRLGAEPGVTPYPGFARRVSVGADHVNVELADHTLSAQGVVLAIGGVVGGGLRMNDGGQFEPSVECEPAWSIWLAGRPLSPSAAAWGVDIGAIGMAAVEAMGLHVHGELAQRLALAGEVEALGPGGQRTALRAALAGIEAVRRLCG